MEFQCWMRSVSKRLNLKIRVWGGVGEVIPILKFSGTVCAWGCQSGDANVSMRLLGPWSLAPWSALALNYIPRINGYLARARARLICWGKTRASCTRSLCCQATVAGLCLHKKELKKVTQKLKKKTFSLQDVHFVNGRFVKSLWFLGKWNKLISARTVYLPQWKHYDFNNQILLSGNTSALRKNTNCRKCANVSASL